MDIVSEDRPKNHDPSQNRIKLRRLENRMSGSRYLIFGTLLWVALTGSLILTVLVVGDYLPLKTCEILLGIKLYEYDNDQIGEFDTDGRMHLDIRIIDEDGCDRLKGEGIDIPKSNFYRLYWSGIIITYPAIYVEPGEYTIKYNNTELRIETEAFHEHNVRLEYEISDSYRLKKNVFHPEFMEFNDSTFTVLLVNGVMLAVGLIILPVLMLYHKILKRVYIDSRHDGRSEKQNIPEENSIKSSDMEGDI